MLCTGGRVALGGGVDMAAIASELESLQALHPGLPLDWLSTEPWRGAAGGDPGTDPTVDPACAGGPPSWPESSAQRSERAASAASASTSLPAAQHRPGSAGRRGDEVRVLSTWHPRPDQRHRSALPWSVRITPCVLGNLSADAGIQASSAASATHAVQACITQ